MTEETPLTAKKETIAEQLNIPVATESQRQRIFLLCERVNRNEMSRNEAYRFSQVDGDTPEEVGYKGAYKDWVNLAIDNGWLNTQEESKLDVVPEPPKPNYVVPILVGIGVGFLIYVIVKKAVKKG